MNLEENKNTVNVRMEDIMRKKFLDYGMSVIVDRALPFAEDGLKPVHRRILWAMNTLDNKHNKPYKKSARIVGEVIGRYHPHGDTAVYDAMVRMAQEFSMRVPLVDGQGNFGSVDGDSPAAMRYTESRMSVFGEKMFQDIEKDSVDMEKNYDGTEEMPSVLPLRFPNLLINGSHGIAVGMATSMPCHNPIEVMNAVIYLLNNENVSEENIDELLKIIPAPDFPTGGTIHDLKEMRNAWLDGRASLKLRANWEASEDMYGNPKIVITEIPYGVKKEELVVKITELASPDPQRDNKIAIEGIKRVQDYSSKEGIQIDIELKKEYDPETIFNMLAKNTRLEVPISYNNTVLINRRPVVMGILGLLQEFIKHRENVIIRRTNYLLNKANNRQHILLGLISALGKLDEVIELIKKSSTNAQAKASLMEFLSIDETQAESVLRMQLRSLTSSEVSDLENEYREISVKIEGYNLILSDRSKLKEVIREETEEQLQIFNSERNKKGLNVYADRQTKYIYHRLDTDLAALTKEEDSVVFFSKNGFIRRMPEKDILEQNRGTRGKRYMKLGKGDFISNSIRSHSHDALMFVSNFGYVYSMHTYELPNNERGRHINNVLELKDGETIQVMLPINYENEDEYLVMVTKKGIVKKTKLTEYSNSFRKSGLRGISIRDNDEIKFAVIAKNSDDVVLAASNNKSIRFEVSEKSLRTLSRVTSGVKGMNTDGAEINDVTVINQSAGGYLLFVTDNGIAKMTDINQYRTQNRGGKGVSAMKCNDRTGSLIRVMHISEIDGSVIISTKDGLINRIGLDKIRATNRMTSGVKLINLSDSDEIISTEFSSLDMQDEDVEDIVEDLVEADS